MHQESNQLAISFDLHKPEFTTLCRNTDPQTSRDAARKVEREGTVARHERLILRCLELNGPSTAKEMQYYMAFHKNPEDRLTSVEISRRSGGLMNTKWKRGHISAIQRHALCCYVGTRDGFGIWSLIVGAL